MTSPEGIRRIILVGKTGNGKSSVGNAILGEKKFEARKSLKAVTSVCSVETSIPRNRRPIYRVCDTPGYFDANSNIAERHMEVSLSITELCPNPHAVLLVLSGANRFTEVEKCMIDVVRVNFGEKVFDHCIIVFTRGNEFENDKHLKIEWNECPTFSALAAKCGNRVVTIENKPKNEESGLDNLLTTIEKVCNNGSKIYDYSEIYKYVEAMARIKAQFNKKTELRDVVTCVEMMERILKGILQL